MRRTKLLWLTFVVSMFLFLPLAEASLNEGQEVTPFTLMKRGGGEARFPEDFKDKVVFINFWASWCPECKIELPELSKINDRFKDRPFVLLAINFDKKPSTAERFLKKIGSNLSVLFDHDSQVVRTFGPVGVPASYLVGPDGTIRKRYLGYKEGYIEKYIHDIEELLSSITEESSDAPEMIAE